MDKYISELRVLYQKKLSNSRDLSSLIKEQLVYVYKLNQEEILEKELTKKILDSIRQLESYKEFNISKETFNKILNEKNVESNLAHIFSNEIVFIEQLLIRLKLVLDDQLKTNQIKNIDEEKNLYDALEKNMQIILDSKSKIITYFNDMDSLTYKRNYIKSGQIISKLIKNMIFRVEVNGIENIPKGPCIIAPHHCTLDDAMLFYAVIDRSLFFPTEVETFIKLGFAEKYYYNLGCMPIKRDESKYMYTERLKNAVPRAAVDNYNSSNMDSLKKMLTHLKNGDAIVIFPEGEIQYGGTYVRPESVEFLPPQEGFVTLAFLTKRRYNISVPIIPVGLKYGRGILGNSKSPLNINKSVRITFGEKMYVANELQNMTKSDLDIAITATSQQIFEKIKELSK